MSEKFYEQSELFFTPADTSSMITRGELTEYLIKVIKEIRAGSNPKYSKFIQEIRKLQKYENDPNFYKGNKNNIELFFNIYHQIINTSLALRALLSEILDLGDYDSIRYAIYYEGKRFILDELKPEWLRMSGKNGLMLDLEKASKSLEGQIKNSYQESIQEVFNDHYKSYLNLIKGTYKGKKEIGQKGSRISLGHVAEAYEEHIGEDHSESYKVLNGDADSNIQNSAVVKAMTALRAAGGEKAYWPPHESVDKGWLHIKHSLGTQRGTVAGDVGQFQVKQAKDKENATIRLARFSTLEQGLKLYSKILGNDTKDSDIPKLAYDLANYISEPVSQRAADVLNFTAGKELSDELKSLRDKDLSKVLHL